MQDLDRLNWDDLRIFLAAMRASSLRQAADALGVSHPTARRRLEALEERLGFTLFERRPDGLHATPKAAGLLPAAETVERAIHGVARSAQSAYDELRGPVRVALPAAGTGPLLMPILAAFIRRWPEVEVVTLQSNEPSNLGQREADVAVRFIRRGGTPGDELTGRKAGTVHRGVYGEGEVWLGWYGDGRDDAWIRRSPFPELPSRGGFDDPELQAAACAAGLGLAWLPCYLAPPGARRRSKPKPEWDIWVLVHPDLRRNPRLRAFRDFLTEGIRDLAPVLQGRTSTAST